MIPEFVNNGAVLVRSFDDYLAIKHSTGDVSPALGTLLRDRYGEDCSVLVCDESAELVFILLNYPTIVIPFCQRHALQVRAGYANLAEHLPILTSETIALFPARKDADHATAHLASPQDESELRDDDDREGGPWSADER